MSNCFLQSKVLLTKKWMRKETNSVSFLQKKYKKLRTMPSQKQRKGHIVQNENIQRYVSGFPLKVAKCQIWTLRFTPSWRLCNNNNFYLSFTEWLASPGGTKFLKPIEEMPKEELNVFQKRFCTSARKKDRTLSFYKISSMKSFWGPPFIVSKFALAAAQQTIFLYLWPCFYSVRQIKH